MISDASSNSDSYSDDDDSAYPFEDTARTFFELGSAQRLAILYKISSMKCNLARLSSDLGCTMPEIRRNIIRLTSSGMVDRQADGNYILTTFGKTILEQIPTLDFLSRNKEYFSDHTFSSLPLKFVRRIGSLSNSKLVSGLVSVEEKLDDIYKRSQRFVFAMIPEVPIDLIESIVARLKKIENKEFRFSYILPTHARVPKRRKHLLEELGFDELLREGIVERKMVGNILTGVVLNDDQACVMFPRIHKNNKTEIDMNSMFYGDDADFHEWCLDYYRYVWHNARSFDEKGLTEI
ncbi:MAG: transcriptional regulator [Thermoproteota archaeon]|nr:transcriptional regulator [Thermoproteota archaeon]